MLTQKCKCSDTPLGSAIPLKLRRLRRISAASIDSDAQLGRLLVDHRIEHDSRYSKTESGADLTVVQV